MLNRTNPLFLIKNSLLLIFTALLFAGCGFSNSEKEVQKKQEIQSEIHKLEFHRKHLIEQKSELQEQLSKTVLDCQNTLNEKNVTATEQQHAQEQLNNHVYAIELQQVKLEKQLLETELNIRKLELEYAKLTRRSKFGI